MSAAVILAIVAGFLFLLALVPQTSNWPLTPLGGLLLSIAVYLSASGR